MVKVPKNFHQNFFTHQPNTAEESGRRRGAAAGRRRGEAVFSVCPEQGEHRREATTPAGLYRRARCSQAPPRGNRLARSGPRGVHGLRVGLAPVRWGPWDHMTHGAGLTAAGWRLPPCAGPTPTRLRHRPRRVRARRAVLRAAGSGRAGGGFMSLPAAVAHDFAATDSTD